GASTVPALANTWLLDSAGPELKRYAIVAWTVIACRAYPVLATATIGRVDDLRHQRAILFPDGHVELVGMQHQPARVFASLQAFQDAMPALREEWAKELAAHLEWEKVLNAPAPANVIPFRKNYD